MKDADTRANFWRPFIARKPKMAVGHAEYMAGVCRELSEGSEPWRSEYPRQARYYTRVARLARKAAQP